MLNQHIAQTIIIDTIFLLAICLAFILAGIGQALVAKWLGDSTADDEGFVTLNPLVHIDALGMILLVIFGIGWISSVPIDPHNIRGPWRTLKLLFLYSTETALTFTLAVISALVYMRCFIAESLLSGLTIFFAGSSSFNAFSAFYTGYPSTIMVIALFILAFIFANIFVAALSCIVNSFRFIIALITQEDSYTLYQEQPLLSLIPFLGILFYFGKLRGIIFYGMLIALSMIFSLLGT